MKWQDLIKKIVEDDFVLSSLEVENLTGIKYQNIDRWLRGEVDGPQKKIIEGIPKRAKYKNH